MNRALPVLALLLFVAWFGGQFASRAARQPPRPAPGAAASAGTVEVRVSPAPSREPAVTFRPRPAPVASALLTVDELSLSGDYDGAIGRLEELLAGDPSRDVTAASLVELARLHMVRRDFRAARALCERFLKEFPGHAERGNIERTLEFMENFERHRESFRPIEEELR